MVQRYDHKNLHVQEFFDSLPYEPGETVIRLTSKREFVLVTPRPKLPDEDWTPEKNGRRVELIDRKIDGSATPTELAELTMLELEIDRWVDKVAPRPLKESQEILDRLLEKARLAEKKRGQ